MRILITGGAGFIGSHIAGGLGEDGHEIVVLDDLSTGLRDNLEDLPIDLELIVGDVRNRVTVKRALVGIDAVVHLAAIASVPASLESPAETGSVNIQGTAILLEEARRQNISRVVLASSSAVYGEGTPPLTEDSPTDPLSPYGAHKLAGEHLARSLALAGGPDTVSLRYFNVYGPRQRSDSDYAAAIPIFFRRIEEEKRPRIFGDGSQTRDFVHVDDVVEANRRALARGGRFNGEAFNVARGKAISIETLAREVLEVAGSDLTPEFADPRPGDILHSSASVEKLRNALGWSPTISIAEGLQTAVPVI